MSTVMISHNSNNSNSKNNIINNKLCIKHRITIAIITILLININHHQSFLNHKVSLL